MPIPEQGPNFRNPPTHEYAPSTDVARALQEVKEKIKRFQRIVERPYRYYPSLAETSIRLGEAVHNKETGESQGFITNSKFNVINLHPNIVGEIMIAAMSEFPLGKRIDSVEYKDRKGCCKDVTMTYPVLDKDYAFVRKQEFRRDEWTSIAWDMIDTAPKVKIPLPKLSISIPVFLRKPLPVK